MVASTREKSVVAETKRKTGVRGQMKDIDEPGRKLYPGRNSYHDAYGRQDSSRFTTGGRFAREPRGSRFTPSSSNVARNRFGGSGGYGGYGGGYGGGYHDEDAWHGGGYRGGYGEGGYKGTKGGGRYDGDDYDPWYEDDDYDPWYGGEDDYSRQGDYDPWYSEEDEGYHPEPEPWYSGYGDESDESYEDPNAWYEPDSWGGYPQPDPYGDHSGKRPIRHGFGGNLSKGSKGVRRHRPDRFRPGRRRPDRHPGPFRPIRGSKMSRSRNSKSTKSRMMRMKRKDYKKPSKPGTGPDGICPLDIKECFDGSFVIRNPLDNCEFFDCPPCTGKHVPVFPR